MVTIKVPNAAFMLLLLLSLAVGAFAGPTLKVADDQTYKLQQGRTATLNASAGGAAWQWLRDGQRINGATQSTYVVSVPGRYQVITYNADGCASAPSDGVNIEITPNAITEADVMITMKAVQATTHLADPFKYVITVKNNGPVDATGVKMQSKLPDEIQIERLTLPTLGSAQFGTADNVVNWTMPQLANGQSAQLDVLVKGTRTGKVLNTATVSANETDINPANNTATAEALLTAGLNIPNVFTPNGDGVNETFEIPGLENYPVNDVVIVNRWGATVYQKKNYKGDWDGSGLNEGTYFYVLRLQTAAGSWDTFKGYVTLLRSKKQ